MNSLNVLHSAVAIAVATSMLVLPAACIVEPAPTGTSPSLGGDPDERTGEAVEAVTSVQLAVTHQTQFATGCASPKNYCCGPTAGNMATAFLHGVAPTAAFLQKGYQYLGLNSCCGTGTSLAQVTQVAKNVGTALGSGGPYCATFANIKTQLQAKHPVAVAVTYNNIGAARRCGTFNVPHVLLITGYDETLGMWYGEDPYCTSGGQSWQSMELRSAAGAQVAAYGCPTGTEAIADFFSL